MCWGGYAALAEVPPGAFVEVDAGFGCACALDAAGWVTCWGEPGFDGAIDISPPWQASG